MKGRFNYTEEEIVSALKTIGISEGDHVFIHSNIGFFGRLQSAKTPTEYYNTFKRAIIKVIGEKGTIVNPTFSYSFCKGKKFDLETTPSTCGIFSEQARLDSDSIRSADPNFSIVATGNKADYFTENPAKHSFGVNSFWERFLAEKGKFLLFNLDVSTLTFFHYMEKLLGVDYRYDKAFKGEMTSPNQTFTGYFTHFVHDLDKQYLKVDASKIQSFAEQYKIYHSATLGRGEISSISAGELKQMIEKEYVKDKNLFLNYDGKILEVKSELDNYFDRLFPITRSLTGNGNRETLDILSEIVDLEVKEVPCGTACFDWNVPPEWNVKEAWIKNSAGETIVDFSDLNLHLMGYSIPVKGTFSFEELKPHLYTLPDQPEITPYVTSYYKERWGFCLPHNQMLSLDQADQYEVFIDASLDKNGSMSIGEAVLPGETKEEILLSTYICHPSMANNELSGPLVTAFIYDAIKKWPSRKYTYRFLFLPETIGSIYALTQYGEHWKENLVSGFVVNCIGDRGRFTYKKSRRGDALCDQVAAHVLSKQEEEYQIIDFFPRGSDERQYCSPGFNLPVGLLMRSMYSRYSEYHTSADNKNFISFEHMERSINTYVEMLKLIDRNETYVNQMPFCEPQLGKRGLYPTIGTTNKSDFVNAMMWVLNLADGTNDLLSIAKRSNVALSDLYDVVDALVEKGLLIEQKQ